MGGKLCPSHYCQPPRIQNAIYTSAVKLHMSGSLHFATSTVLSLIIYKYFVPEFFLWELHQIGRFINPLLLLESVGNLKWGAWPHDPNIYIRGWNYGILGFWSNLVALLALQFLAVASWVSIMIFLKNYLQSWANSQSDNHFYSKRQPRTIKITWLNSKKPKTIGHVERAPLFVDIQFKRNVKANTYYM